MQQYHRVSIKFEIRALMMQNLIANQLKIHILRELACQKYKKNDLLKIHAKIFDTQTNSRKQDIVTKLADKIYEDVLLFVTELEKKNLSRMNMKEPLMEYLTNKLSELNIGEIAVTFNKRVEDILNCQSGEEASLIFNHRQLRPTQEIILSVWDEVQDRFTDCLCPKAPSNLDQNKRKEACYVCGQLCHVECFWSREKDELFECPFCFLKNCLPNRAAKGILFAGYLPILKKEKAEYKIGFALSSQAKLDKNLQVEARCVKFNSKNRFEISWPDNCNVWLGKYKLQQFKPLMTNSPLKRRYDEPIKLEKSKLNSDNLLIIEEKNISDHTYRINKKCIHLVAVMLVQDLGKQQLQNIYLKNILTIEQSQQTLKDYLEKGSQQLKVERMSISLKCQYYGNKISYPVRSKHCTSHYQPFDLNNFIYSSLQAKNSTKKWKCPICDKRAYDIILDEYILDLMRKSQRAMEITFQSSGLAVMGNEVSENEDDEQEEFVMRKEKKDANRSELINLETPQEGEQSQEVFIGEDQIQQEAIVLEDSEEENINDEYGEVSQKNHQIADSEQIYQSEETPEKSHTLKKRNISSRKEFISQKIRKLRKYDEYEISEKEFSEQRFDFDDDAQEEGISESREIDVIYLSSNEEMGIKQNGRTKKNRKALIKPEARKLQSREQRKHSKSRKKICSKKVKEKKSLEVLSHIGKKVLEIIEIQSSENEQRKDNQKRNEESLIRKQLWKKYESVHNSIMLKNFTQISLPKTPLRYVIQYSDGEIQKFPPEERSVVEEGKPTSK